MGAYKFLGRHLGIREYVKVHTDRVSFYSLFFLNLTNWSLYYVEDCTGRFEVGWES